MRSLKTFRAANIAYAVDGMVGQAQSLVYLDGTEIDFAKEGLNEGFKFINPNEKDRCGCGESFTV